MNKTQSYNSLRGFYWQVIKKFPVYFTTIFLCGIIGNVLQMVFGPLTSKWMIQIFESATNPNWQYILNIFIMLAALYFFTVALDFSDSWLRGRYQQIVNRYKLYLLYKRVYANDISFFIENPSGQIISQTQEISMRFNYLVEDFWVDLIGTILGFFLIVGAMFSMNIWFVVIWISYGAIKLFWEWSVQKKITEISKLEMEESSKYSGMRSDSLNNALTAKYFANTEHENKYIYNGRAKLIEIIRKNFFLQRCQWVPTGILWHVSRLSVLILCFIFIRSGSLSISDAVFIMTSAQTLNAAFSNLNEAVRRYSVQSARATKAYENMIKPQVIVDKPNAKKLKVKRATIDFDNVNFGYGDKQVLHNFNLNIDRGEKVGIVGLSGAGKTTLCNLLLRMYDVDGGAILVDGHDIRDVGHDSLLRNISFVPQESTLFNRTILENIRYARPTATKQQVVTAAKKAHIHEFIESLPNGYNTLVGNNGVKLSGGQRQRISIARALLKDAPILILDEATSALDSENETQIQKSLVNVMRGKTSVVIAHRLSTLRHMDRIIVIRRGKIVEMGSHKQLLQQGGLYRRLWNMQTSGFVS
ncbi:MAG: ABC transporter ATP-binding protein [Alphaproteobacteria bacterium]|nr:ABC transporter ATP-binding protein [Alphaproteobacteria bacterium]